MSGRKTLLFLLCVILGVFGCAQIAMHYAGAIGSEAERTKVEDFGYLYDPKPNDCPIEIFAESVPEKKYQEIGKLESHIELNVLVSSKQKLDSEVNSELSEHSCRLGGDAVRIDDSTESSTGEMMIVHVWATVLKYE